MKTTFSATRTIIALLLIALFAFAAEAANPVTQVLSPLAGKEWRHNQHGTGFHGLGAGINGTDDSFAWDSNLSNDRDAGYQVRASASGKIVAFAGLTPGIGGTYGIVLVEHKNAAGVNFWIGYLHLDNIQVKVGQSVNEDTVLGYVGDVGATNNHLHWAIYKGSNTRRGLESFNVSIIDRKPKILSPRAYTYATARIEARFIGQERKEVEEYEVALVVESSFYSGTYLVIRKMIKGYKQENVSREYHSLTFTPSDLWSNNSRYTFYVRARYGSTWTEWNSKSFYLSVRAPNTPSNITPSGWQTISWNNMVSWTADPDVTAYHLVYVWKWDWTRGWQFQGSSYTQSNRYDLSTKISGTGYYCLAVQAIGPGGATHRFAYFRK